MSRDGSVTFAWADAEHRFRLGLGELRELQEKCDAGPAWVLERLTTRRWLVEDLREPIRLGLIGGGMSPADALRLVARYVDNRPLFESVPAAQAILLAALVGAEDEPAPGKQEAAEESPVSPAGSSPSPPSTATAPPSASPPGTSTP